MSRRAERLLDLVSLFLGSDRPIPWAEIRGAFPDYRGLKEASALRKFERDRAELVELGLPLQWVPPDAGREGGYRLAREDYYLPDLELTAEERTLLSLAGAAALEQPAFPLRDELVRALDKLFFASSFRWRASSDSLLRTESEHLERLGRATVEHRDVRLRYRSYDGETTERRVSPYGLAFRSGAWFLVGRCHLRDAIRTFAVERIEALEELDSRFEVPAGFDVRRHVGVQAWEIPRHEPREAVVEVAPGGLPLAHNIFGPGDPLEGGARFALRTSNEDALVRIVLRLFPHARVLSPASLAEKVREAARRIAARHAGAPKFPLAAPRAADHPRAPESPPNGAAVVLHESAPETHTAAQASERVAVGSESAPAEPATGKPSTRRSSDPRQRLQRALLLVPRALARHGCTLAELAADLRISEEELLEEIDFLQLVGRPPFSPADLVDIDVVDGRVYVALPQGFSRPPALTPLEALALEAAASAFTEEGGESLRAVRERLRQAIPAAFRGRFDALSGRIRVEARELSPEVADRVDRAIRERRELSFSYFSAARGEATRRRVRPLRRFPHQGYWYLYAFCCQRRERRLFRLDRASDFRLEEATFVPRPVDEAPFAVREGERLAWVRVDPGPFARPGHLWRLGAREIHHLPDGGALARVPVHGEAYVLSSVLFMAGAAEILEPADLRERAHHVSREIAGTV